MTHHPHKLSSLTARDRVSRASRGGRDGQRQVNTAEGRGGEVVKRVIKKSHVDLRCSRRLTVNEARLVLKLLNEAKGRTAHTACRKVAQAVLLADHTCELKYEFHNDPFRKGKRTRSKLKRCTICGRSEAWEPRPAPKEFKEFHASGR